MEFDYYPFWLAVGGSDVFLRLCSLVVLIIIAVILNDIRKTLKGK